VLLVSGGAVIEGTVAMVAGEVRVDVLEIGEQALEDPPEDPTGRLYV
jgi:hypothetical protein